MNAQSLIYLYGYTAEVVLTQLEDLTHEESLVQIVPDGHSINWLLGHLISSRRLPMQLVNADYVWTDEVRAPYANGSAPINADIDGVLYLDELVIAFDEAHSRLIDSLRGMSDDALKAPSTIEGKTIYDRLAYYAFHETYHVGQMTMIAQFLGKPTAYLK